MTAKAALRAFGHFSGSLIKMLLSYNNNEKAGRIASQYCSPMQPKVVQLPVIPNELPEVLQSLSNKEFETHTKNAHTD